MTRNSHNTNLVHPPKNHVVNDKSGATVIAEFGAFTIDFCDGLLRIHNGVTSGGCAVLALAPVGSKLAPPVLANAIEMPASEAENETDSLTVVHGVGAKPVVQVMNKDTGELEDVVVTHIDDNQFKIEVNTPHSAYEIIYRF